MAFDTRELRSAFGSFMTGVTVVTAVSKSGEKVGFTANSFTSVSIDPPLVLICPAKSLSSFDIFNACEYFSISILSEDQQAVSNAFATGKGDRFIAIDWYSDVNGVPLIRDAVAHFSCSTYKNVDAGDHTILVGEVKAFDTSDKLGLGYARGGYFSLGMEHRAEELSQKHTGMVGVILEFQDKVLLIKTAVGYRLPQVQNKPGQGSQQAIRQYLKDQGFDAEVGSVFSIYENLSNQSFSTYYRAVAVTQGSVDSGEFVAVNKLPEMAYVSSDIQSMMQRYSLEKQNGVFRVYVGDDRTGDVH